MKSAWRALANVSRAPSGAAAASFAYVLMCALRRALAGTELARASCGSIRLKLLKIGARVTQSVRRIRFAMTSACPFQREWAIAYARLSGQAA
jgi:hypothetical protein